MKKDVTRGFHKGPPPKSCFDWEATREKRRERRRLEGASEEEIAREEIPGDLVVWSPGQLNANEKNRKPKREPKPPKPKKERTSNGPAPGSPSRRMTDREKKQVLALHDLGWGNAEIAREVGYQNTSIKAFLTSQGRVPIDGRSRRFKR